MRSDMRIARGIALGLAVLVLPMGAYAESTGSQVDVRGFLTAYAGALKIELPRNADAGTLLAALKARGVKLDERIDLSKPLEQGDVARIGRANGLRISTSSPERAFTSLEVDEFFTTYGWILAGMSG